MKGCDVLILLNYKGSERKVKVSKILWGFEVIEDVKKVVEEKCLGVVFCVDIFIVVVRDVIYLFKGFFWVN